MGRCQQPPHRKRAAGHPRFFFRNDTGRIEVVAGSLSDTGLYWDYYLSYIDDMSPRELENCWNKPEAIIKTYKADSKPVAIILRTLPDTTGIPTDTLALDSIALSQNKVAN